MKRFALAALLALLSSVALAQTITTSIVLGWTAPTTNSDGSAIAAGSLTYQVYQGPKAGPWTKVNATPITGTTLTVTSLAAGNCFVVAALESQGTTGSSAVEGATSSPPACAFQPGGPTGLTLTVTVTLK